jgi:drug/metabolite transporter (DMT)-like permease
MTSRPRIALLTVLAVLAFAGNSLLCRLALKTTSMDAASFTVIRLVSGAMTLWLIMKARKTSATGSWTSAAALFVYAGAFSFAYVNLPAATGALILFGSVQFTMLGYGVAKGDRLSALQITGMAMAACGLITLLLPGLAAPSLTGATLMTAAGVAWAVYSLRGRDAGDPARATAGNFIRAVPFAAALAAVMLPQHVVDIAGICYALASGAVTSATGYIIWYAAVKQLKATTAASVQLSVPALTALGGIAFLGEPLTWRLALLCLAILGGVALAVLAGKTARPA